MLITPFALILLTVRNGFRNALLGDELITVLASVATATDATLGRMALEIGGGAGAEVHAVFAVEALGTNVGTVFSHPAGQANALSIVLAAIDVILAATALRAALAIGLIGTGLIASGARPARQAGALSILVITFTLVLTIALKPAVGTVETRRTGVFTGETQVTRTTDDLAGNMITCGVACVS